MSNLKRKEIKMATKKEECNFEELIEKLEEITNKLEKEQLSLDESVKLFEEGIELSKKCDSKLEDAEKRITILIKKDNEIKEENFSPEE